MRHLPREFSVREEIYVPTAAPYSRKDVDVLARMDASKVDLTMHDCIAPIATFP
jgi:hypothetical protein